MEVILGELFGRVAGGVDDTHRTPLSRDRDDQGARPASVGAGLRETMGAGYHESGLGSAEHELYGASAGGGERAWHVGDPDGRLCDEGEVYGSHEADPILFQLLPCLPDDCLWRGFGVELFWRGGGGRRSASSG